MNKAFFLFLGTAFLVIGCKKDEVPPPPPPQPAPTTASSPAVTPALPPAGPAAEKPSALPASAPAPAPVPALSASTPPPAAAPVAPAAPASPAAGKDSLATTTAQALKQGALDTLQRIATDARTNLLPAAASVAPPATNPAGAPAGTVTALAELSTDQVTRGLKEALAKGLQQAIGSLGHSGGFMTNLNVKIPMPEKLQTLEQTLRALHQDRYADDFIATMNQAAEQAVPAAAEVFTGSLSKMTVADARKILNGPTNAATLFFRQTSEKELRERFLPIVQKATATTGVTAAYKQILDRAKLASPFLGSTAVDVDGYVTDKALDGLFKMVADEEKHIRENPVARTTDLLKSVFGSLGH